MKITAVILTKNSQDLIGICIKSVNWCNEILVVDDYSSDKTIAKAKKLGAKVISYDKKDSSFSERRNFVINKTDADWLLYIDHDEIVSTELKNEIIKKIRSDKYSGYAIPRRNILLGKELKHGGWYPDYVLRLIRKNSLVAWYGELHEQPKINGEISKLKNPLLHTSHRSLSEMVAKTNKWSEMEAKLLFDAGHPKVVWWRFISVAFREFWYRGVLKLGFLDGTEGVIEIVYQMYSRMITYVKLWEMQENKKK